MRSCRVRRVAGEEEEVAVMMGLCCSIVGCDPIYSDFESLRESRWAVVVVAMACPCFHECCLTDEVWGLVVRFWDDDISQLKNRKKIKVNKYIKIDLISILFDKIIDN